ncbi:AAEL007425-PA [Aedes aegypti]|uniref:AAEL007425-PA n=1 Tax=Aedes aegypti TaxID=7159 RepID=Q0IF02_AEDAE|nr:AAEL007425-PA [Aedes aegypti]
MVHSGAYLSHYLLRPPPSSSAISQLYSTAINASSCRCRKTTVFRKATDTSAPLLKYRNSSIQIVVAAEKELRSLDLYLRKLAKAVSSTLERDSICKAQLLLLDQSRLG